MSKGTDASSCVCVHFTVVNYVVFIVTIIDVGIAIQLCVVTIQTKDSSSWRLALLLKVRFNEQFRSRENEKSVLTTERYERQLYTCRGKQIFDCVRVSERV